MLKLGSKEFNLNIIKKKTKLTANTINKVINITII